jgi:hypothetical protein
MGTRHKPEETIAKLRKVEVMTGQGTSMADAVRSIGVTKVTYYRRRREYGGIHGARARSGPMKVDAHVPSSGALRQLAVFAK